MNNEVRAHLLRTVSSFKFSPALTKSKRLGAETERGNWEARNRETECIESQKWKTYMWSYYMGIAQETSDIRHLI